MILIFEKDSNKSKFFIHEEIKYRLNSRNACYSIAQNRLSSRLLFANVYIKMQKTVKLSL
jgi:hypothetical protein